MKEKSRFFIGIGVMAMFLSSSLFAGSVEETLHAFYAGNYKLAYASFQYQKAHSDRNYVLESLIFLNLKDTPNAQASFKRIKFKSLHLGPYEMSLKLKMSLLTEEETPSQSAWIDTLVSSISEYPSFKHVLMDTAEWHRAHHREDKANNLLTRFQKTPLHADSTLLLNKSFQDSPEDLSELMTSSEDLLKLTRTWFQSDRSRSAKVGAKLFIKKYPTSSNLQEVFYMLGMSQFLLSEYEESSASFKLCLEQSKSTQWADKALFYLGRSYQKKKTFDQALDVYNLIINDHPQSSFVPEAYNYAYWIYKSKADLAACETLINAFKKRSQVNEYLDRILWEYGFDLIESKQVEKALLLWEGHSWTLDSEVFLSKLYFWIGKAKHPFDPKGSAIYFKKCLEKYPLSYYSFRIKSLGLVPSKSPSFSHESFKADEKVMQFYRLGLGDWIREDLEFKARQSKQTYSQIYTLSHLQSLTDHRYQSVNIWYQKGLSMVAKDGHVYKDVAKMVYPRPYWNDVQKSANEFSIDPYLLLALMREESLFNPGAKSRTGALGLTQIMPSTGQGIAKSIGIKWTDSSLLTNPTLNIRMGAYYVSILSDRFGGEKVAILSGYNAGPNITKKWTSENPLSDIDQFVLKIPYSETQTYVAKVLKSYAIYKWLYR